MSKTSLDFIAKKLSDKVESEILKMGIQYRIFFRAKDFNSITEKINRKIKEEKPYSESGKKMQDIFGIRIVTYFQDDIPLALSVLDGVFKIVDKEIDSPNATVFAPKRTNIIYSLPDDELALFNEYLSDKLDVEYKLLDSTFELQLRTVLSEGWHEIDHNLRYKCKSDWELHAEKERMLNGIYASLETNDIAMKNLFNELAYQHFKAHNWEGMLRTKFRIKFKQSNLDTDIIHLLNDDYSIGKSIIKIEREEALSKLAKFDNNIPLTISNFFYILNFTCLKNSDVDLLISDALKELIIKFYHE